jgi:hypothetical protein
MGSVMPSQAAASILRYFPNVKEVHAKSFSPESAGALRGIVDLVKQVPQELLILPADDYGGLIVGLGTIEQQLSVWASRGDPGSLRHEPLRRIWIALSKCPDEYPPPSTHDLTFIVDLDLRENIRRDIGAISRALTNIEWKAANVLAGAAIEALLHWKLNQSPPSTSEIASVVSAGKMNMPSKNDLNWWGLEQFIGLAEHRGIIKADTVSEARLAQDYRNLIHPGRSARLSTMAPR